MSVKRIIVVGAGAWGGWSAYLLQKAGYEVTLIDKSGAGNVMSGSGGKTRIIRMAYGGSQVYTDMVHRSFQLWERYAEDWNEDFYHAQKALWLFRGITPDYATRSQPIMRQKGYQLDEISLDSVAEAYPQINLTDITSAFWEPKVGYLEADRACKVVKRKFEEIGGTYVEDEVLAIHGSGQIESLEMKSGRKLKADTYVFACGPWMKNLFPELAPLIKVTRQEIYYFEAPPKHMIADLPIWLEFREGDRMFYGIPDHFNEGFKLAYDQRDWLLDLDKDDRDVTPEILAQMSEVVVNRFPALAGAALVKHHTCVYESSLDGDYIMDQVTGFKNALMLCGSSGHGFKMGPAVGEMVTAYLQQAQDFPADFKLQRLQSNTTQKSPYEVS